VKFRLILEESNFMRKLKKFFLFILISIANLAAADTDWELAKEAEGIKVYTP
jgi:hypothetical protein